MSNQDPLKPNDTAALMEQLSTLMNIESQTPAPVVAERAGQPERAGVGRGA